ncbi:hypothetical protein [Sporolituus thermophilus]|uniref:Uncharacterized protein n=1 Tax=Sporolituus thermophilus DSM 23256 TaxID=1123285 RepID=A0A1G7KAD4_9FIRM|nr:hypothetical protein [Sporolituus thermophilus]SDF34116.1 hypothetical protein SAMN05660235_01270 [Sporolituus thermophilus DSM 23256]
MTKRKRIELRKTETEKAILEANLKKEKDRRNRGYGQRLAEDVPAVRGRKNILEVRKFIGNYIEKVIVYKDHVEVVFFFSCGDVCRSEAYHFKVHIKRE